MCSKTKLTHDEHSMVLGSKRGAQGKRSTFKLITFYGDDPATENNDNKMRKYTPCEAHIEIQCQLSCYFRPIVSTRPDGCETTNPH